MLPGLLRFVMAGYISHKTNLGTHIATRLGAKKLPTEPQLGIESYIHRSFINIGTPGFTCIRDSFIRYNQINGLVQDCSISSVC